MNLCQNIAMHMRTVLDLSDETEEARSEAVKAVEALAAKITEEMDGPVFSASEGRLRTKYHLEDDGGVQPESEFIFSVRCVRSIRSVDDIGDVIDFTVTAKFGDGGFNLLGFGPDMDPTVVFEAGDTLKMILASEVV